MTQKLTQKFLKMRILNTLAFLPMAIGVVSLAGCQTVAPAPAAPSGLQASQVPDMKRPNLVVADMERSLALYRDLLGFEASEIRPGGKDSYSYPVFNVPQEADLRFVSLHEPSEKRVMNLTEVTGITLPRPASAPYMSTVVIGISDLVAKFEKLKAMGLEITESKVAGTDEFTFIEQAFVDPDGHLIVCYETLR